MANPGFPGDAPARMKVGNGPWEDLPENTTIEETRVTAVERGMEMMLIPMGELPKLALDFAKKLCSEAGMCGEVLLTAWTVYAQCVEGLPCDDELYKARPQDIEWFNRRT